MISDRLSQLEIENAALREGIEGLYKLIQRPAPPFVDPAWLDWQASIPEPEAPKIAAGESCESFGNAVYRITDQSTSAGGGNWQHFYCDRSPLNLDSKFLVMQDGGGGTWFQHMDSATGKPLGNPFRPSSPGGAITAEGLWSPLVASDYCCIVDAAKLMVYDVSHDQWTLLRDFTEDLKAAPAARGKLMYFDGHKFVIDYANGKQCQAIIFYDFEPDEASVHIGTRAADWTPGRFLNGTNSPMPKSGKWHFTQADGGGVTRTYRHPFGSNPFENLEALAGPHGVFHGTSLTNHHIRAASEEPPGIINGWKFPWDWITAFRKCDLTAESGTDGRFPYSDIFLIPASYGMAGIHLSSNGPSDDWIIAGLYQERGTERRTGPLAHEIIAIDTRVSATHDAASRTITQGRIRRLAHHFSWPHQRPNDGYWATPRPAMSLDQRFAVFTSSLGNSGRHDVFCLKLPDLQ
jgi:hypothetical protein